MQLQLSKIFDYLKGLEIAANDYDFVFDLYDIDTDDVSQIVKVRLYSDVYDRFLTISDSYTSIIDSTYPGALARSRLRIAMSSFQSI